MDALWVIVSLTMTSSGMAVDLNIPTDAKYNNKAECESAAPAVTKEWIEKRHGDPDNSFWNCQSLDSQTIIQVILPKT